VPLSIYILEEIKLSNTRYSARTTRLKADGNLNACVKAFEPFSSQDSFKTGLYKTMKIAQDPTTITDAKMLIISAHGIPLTGTSLETSDGKSINFAANDIQDFFDVLPSNLIIWVSACFGGYPSVIRCLQRSSLGPMVAGPLVPIIPKHAIEYQNLLIDLIGKHGIDERPLATATSQFNNKYHHEYFEYPIRFVGATGTTIIPEIELLEYAPSTSVEREDSFLLIAMQGIKYGDPIHVVLQNNSGYWLSSSAAFSDCGNLWDFLGHKISFRYQVLSQPEDGSIGKLNPVGKLKKHPSRLDGYSYKYSHCTERPPKLSNKPITVPSKGDNAACIACNWARLTPIRSSTMSLGVECYRETCPEHEAVTKLGRRNT
jgi:hypothetical protein